MKERVVEDRGQLPIINHAVYAAAAALLHHNNLGTFLPVETLHMNVR